MAFQAIPLADNVVEAINAKTDYSNGITPNAQRRLLVNLKANKEKITELKVFVSTGTLESEPATRSISNDDYTVRVFVYENVPRIEDTDLFDESKIEELLNFVGEMQTQVIEYADQNKDKLRTLGEFVNSPIMDDTFMESGTFLSVTEFTFRTYRELAK